MASPTKAPSAPILPFSPDEENNKPQAPSSPESKGPQRPSLEADADLEAVVTVEKMAPRNPQRGGGRSQGGHRREADLSAVLSSLQKKELILLTASITNAMQEHIKKIFDQQTSSPSFTPSVNTVPFNTEPNTPVLIDRSSNIVQRTSSEQRENVPGSNYYLGELRKEALAAFQRWHVSITKRVSEITVSAEHSVHTSQGQAKLEGKNAGRAPCRGLGRPGDAGGNRGASNVDAQSMSISGTSQHSTGAGSEASTVPLSQMASDKRRLLVHSMILLALSLDAYQAYSRSFISRLAAHLRIPPPVVAEEESRVAWGISHAASNAFTEEGVLRKSDEGRKERRGRASGPANFDATLCLAKPLIVAKIGSLKESSGLSAPAAATVLGNLGTLSDGGLAACVFFGMCGPRGSIAKTLDAFTKDVQDMGLLRLHGSQKLKIREGNTVAPDDRRLRLTIGISGWSHGDDDSGNLWRVLGDKTEAYALRWEQESLEKIGASISTVSSSVTWQNAQRDFTARNVFASLKSFKWPSGLLKISKIVDNPWSVGMVRADKVGIALADAIVNKVFGERGVSLLGYGLGARVIYTCLMSLSERRAFGQIENVLVMGTPAPSSRCVWTALRSVVSGRVINVFSENDFILGFLHRTGCVQYGIAGLQRIQDVYGIENVDASRPVTNHLRYSSLVGRILKDVGWDDLNLAEINKREELKTSCRDMMTSLKAQDTQLTESLTSQQAKDAKRAAGRKGLEARFQAMNIVNYKSEAV